jgi:pantoate--beta-alanine ligase
MLIAGNISEIRSQLKKERSLNKKIALVPTMGALHEGHLALVKKAAQLSEIVVVSIFVNKAQFDDLSDYQKYPKTIDKDLELLKNSGATHVFVPESLEIFSEDFSFKILPTSLANCLCGSSRVGHFDGVALIVAKLFNIIAPNIAVFGEKDFQQIAIIKKLVSDLNFDLEIFSHETVRDSNGLAMSSRNQRLSQDLRVKAAEIFQTLMEIKIEVKSCPNQIEQILEKSRKKLLQNGFEKIDYLEIRQEKNLSLVQNQFDANVSSRIFAAIHLGGVRLIDNMSL